MQFTKGMSIQEALEAHPKAREVFVDHGMGCIDCMASTLESIELGANMHGVDAEALVKDLNELFIKHPYGG